MKRQFTKTLYIFLLVLLVIPAGVAGIRVVHAESESKINSLSGIGFAQEVYAFIEAPKGPVAQPYVILTGYQSSPGISETLEIRGVLFTKEFVCSGIPCILPVPDTTFIIFRAATSAGNQSDEIQATIRVVQSEGGYLVTIDSLNQYFKVADACGSIWGNTPTVTPTWAEFPQLPSGLDTNKPLHNLVKRLINFGIVDARSCPDGGLTYGAPNGCGIERAAETMTKWQNQFNFPIWLSGKNYQLPPRLLKTLIEIESQFWPANERAYLDEIGLGQVNHLGMDVLLRQNHALYQELCSAVLSTCNTPYAYLSPAYQAMVRGALLDALDANCPTCPYGLDMARATQSVPLIASLLRANCSQVNSLLDAYQVSASYEDNWKYTLVSYHSGIGCLQSALDDSLRKSGWADWAHVSQELACWGSLDYVNRFWFALATFDNYRLAPGGAVADQVAPVFVPTKTPVPTPTPQLSFSKVAVSAILDKNGDGIPEESEWLDGIPVELRLATGKKLTGTTVKGPLFFDMGSYPAGMVVTVSLPGLYRSTTFRLPEQGLVPVVFIFTQPVMPTALP